MKKIYKLLLFVSTAILVGTLGHAQVEVEFTQAGQTTDESGSVSIVIQLSEPSLLEVQVPYIITGDSTAVLDTDFEIPEDVDDPGPGEVEVDNESPIVFEPGQTIKAINILITNDSDDESDETFTLQLVDGGLTNAVLGGQLTHTVNITDNDPVDVEFAINSAEFYENENIFASVQLSGPSPEAIEVTFTVTPLTANANDIDLDSSATTDSPLTIPAGATSGSIAVSVFNDSVTDRNEGGADRETVSIQLTGASLADSGTSLSVNPQVFEATIIDNDPLTLNLLPPTNADAPYETEEYEVPLLRLQLTAPDGTLSVAADEIDVPVTYGGSASRGEGDENDYDAEDSPITINPGVAEFQLALSIENDDLVEGNETIDVTIGSPSYQDGGDIVLGPDTQVSYTIIDNDPVTLSFGAFFQKDDREAALDPDLDEVTFVPSGGSAIAEGTGQVFIPYFLSSFTQNQVEFDLEIVGAGTTATVFVASENDDGEQDWDFTVTSHDLDEFDSTTSVRLLPNFDQGVIQVLLNNDDETPVPFGGSPAPDVESDETVQFRISNLNTNDSQVQLGDFDTYNLLIRELPDIDVTGLFQGLSPLASGLVNGSPRFNLQTGLHEVDYRFVPSGNFDPSQFAGYFGYKFVFRTANYDASDPDSEGNDPVVEIPSASLRTEGTPYTFFVDPPFRLRYQSGAASVTLAEGVDQTGSDFFDIHADTIEEVPFLLRPLDLPLLNDFESSPRTVFDINAPFDWTIQFLSRGFFNLPLERIDPASNPERLKVYLTADADATEAFNTLGNPVMGIRRMEPQADGSMLLLINSSGAANFQVQYLDPGEDWTVAGPSVTATGGGSLVYWLDTGPPLTRTHPSNVNFRLYRVVQTQ